MKRGREKGRKDERRKGEDGKGDERKEGGRKEERRREGERRNRFNEKQKGALTAPQLLASFPPRASVPQLSFLPLLVPGDCA